MRGSAEQRRHAPVHPARPRHLRGPPEPRAFAIRSVWFERGAAPYLGSLSAMRADDLADFSADMGRWCMPSVNMVYADTGGNIAWIVVGLTPMRPNWNGLLPVPGDGRYEWDGFFTPEHLPASSSTPRRLSSPRPTR